MYTDSFSATALFDVLHTTVEELSKYPTVTHHEIHLIVYKSPSTNSGLEFVITMQCETFTLGLKALLGQMQGQLGSSIGKFPSRQIQIRVLIRYLFTAWAREATKKSRDQIIHSSSDGLAISVETLLRETRNDRIRRALGDQWVNVRK